MLYRSVYLYFQSHVIFLSNIENSYKMELPFSTHPFSYPSPLIHIKSHETLSYTHTHTLPSNYERYKNHRKLKSQNLSYLFISKSCGSYTPDRIPPPPIIREYLSRDSANLHWPKMFFLLFFSLLSFFPSLSPPVVRLLQLIQPGSLKSN